MRDIDREWYVDTIRHWMDALEDRWDEESGYYRVPQSVRANGMLISPMLVLIGEGEEHWKGRILRMAERMVQSPPYDERYRYFNWNMNQTGGEIHQAGCMTQVGLSFVLHFMGLASTDYLHHDQDYIRSLRSLERLRVAYPHYGFEVRQCSEEEIRLAITPWEWQENRRMRVNGKNLDYVWVWEPTWMRKEEERTFSYEIRPFSSY